MPTTRHRGCSPARGLLRATPLAGALLAAGMAAHADTSLSVATPGLAVGDHRGVAALFGALRSRHRPVPPHTPTTSVVTSCADDGGAGTLRAVVAAAGQGDTVDLTALTCSTITLAQGAIPVLPDDLTLTGPGASKLTVDGAGLDRVFVHYGYGTLRLDALAVRNGFNRAKGYHVAGGACLLSNGYVTLDHGTVSGCTAIGEGAYGGGILARGVTLYASTLSNNLAQGSLLNTLTASYGAGAFAYRGTAVLYDSTVSGNRATIDPANTHGSYDPGAGIFTDYGGSAVRSTIAGNYTDGAGGGVASHGSFLVSNSTISGNVASRGAGLFLFSYNSFLAVNNSTITANQAADGGGIYITRTPSSVDLQSSIVAGNRASAGSADVSAQVTLTFSGANNLVMAASARVTLPADTLHSDPLLLPLAQNGGPTLTHALAVASPARDAGNNAAGLATDQRGDGFARVIGAAADIGAFEAAAVQPMPNPVPALPLWATTLLAVLIGALAFWRRPRSAA